MSRSFSCIDVLFDQLIVVLGFEQHQNCNFSLIELSFNLNCIFIIASDLVVLVFNFNLNFDFI